MKYNYDAMRQGKIWIIRRTSYKNLCIFDEYFHGYDFMGTANWGDSILSRCVKEFDSKSEAECIIADLKAADEPTEPEKVVTKDQLRIVLEAAQNWMDHLNYRGVVDYALENAIAAMKAEV